MKHCTVCGRPAQGDSAYCQDHQQGQPGQPPAPQGGQGQPEHQRGAPGDGQGGQAQPPAPQGGQAQPPAPQGGQGQPEHQRGAPDTGRLDQLEARVATIESTPAIIGDRGASPLARFASFGEYCRAAFTDQELGRELARTLATQVTGNNAGVLGGGPGWLSDVKGIVSKSRPAVEAFGVRPLADSGMTVDWPVFTGSLSSLVAAQANQLDEVASVQVDIGSDNIAVKTYSGGSRMSKQLVERSTPPYRDSYERIMLAAYALTTDAAFVAQLLSDATGAQTYHGLLGPALEGTAEADDEGIDITGHGLEAGDRVIITAKTTGGTDVFTLNQPYYVLAVDANSFQLAETAGGAAIAFATDYSAITVRQILGDDGTGFLRALFGASITLQDVTGQPAAFVLAGSRLFEEFAGMARIVPIGPSNAVGTLDAAALRINVSGVTVQRDPNVSAWGAIASNSSAAGFHEDGPKPLSAEVVGNLGTDVAIYGFGAAATYLNAGVVVITP